MRNVPLMGAATDTSGGRKAGYTKDQKARAEAEAGAPAAPKSDTAGWVDVALRRPYYNVASCRATPIVGYLIAVEQVKTKHGVKDQLVFKLTRPALAIAKKDEAPAEVPAGTEITVMASADLQRLAGRLREDRIAEFSIQPLDRDQTVSGSPWRFQIAVNPDSVKPRPAALGPTHVQLAIPAEGETGSDSDIPF